jgi:hypothetical protein
MVLILNLDMQGISVDYIVNYYSEGVGGLDLLLTQNLPAIFDDGASVVGFGLDTGVLGALINLVEITTSGYQFMNGARDEPLEWDFLLASVEFGQGASPVPLPAALPLFMSALLGGFVAARRKKSSDHKVSS